MRVLKCVCRWIGVLLCLGALFSYGLFSVSGFVGLVVAVLLLPVAPVRALWKMILPSDAPRFAKHAILAAAFLLMMAAAQPVEESAIPEATASPAAPTATASPVPTPSATPEPAQEMASPRPTAEADSGQAEEAESTVPQSGMVYVAGSGKGSKYHSDPGCSNMKDPTAMTQAEAESRGYTPCKRCCD